MGKDLSIAVLFDFYGELLTEKQAKALDLYYNEDLSLAEIAAPLGISRQGVLDSIKRGEQNLLELEKTLGLAKRFRDVKDEVLSLQTKVKQVKDGLLTLPETKELAKTLSQVEDSLLNITDKL